MHILKKLIQADPSRLTRFHTQSGEFVRFMAWVELPISLSTWALLKLTGWRPLLPWWVFGAIAFVKKRIRFSDHVFEDGSGTSSLWLAKRTASVISLESNQYWGNYVQKLAQRLNLSNLDLILADVNSSVESVLKKSGQNFDVVVIDGPGDRMKVLQSFLSMENLPRIIVYDNTDRISDSAAKPLCKAAGYAIHSFRGYAPTLIHANETTIFVLDEK